MGTVVETLHFWKQKQYYLWLTLSGSYQMQESFRFKSIIAIKI